MKVLRIKCNNIATLLQKHGLQEIQKIIVNVFLKFIRDYDRAFLTSIVPATNSDEMWKINIVCSPLGEKKRQNYTPFRWKSIKWISSKLREKPL